MKKTHLSVVHERQNPLVNPLIIALDVDTDARAYELADDLGEFAGGFKIGPRLIHRYGAKIVKEISQRAPVFVDCKYFDIPSTMVAAVQASFDSGASLVTVHAMAGEEALKEVAALEEKLNDQRPFRVLAVTILTSWTEQTMPSVLKPLSVQSHVQELASLAASCGIQGIVCSPMELDILKDKNLFLVTPGIRFDEDEAGDQKRFLGPNQAIQKGATAIVVGRPIIEAKNPREAAMDYSLPVFNKPK